ncbi:TPA: hypothetical protein I8608_001010 [Morganella morganii]|jgi:hypothetical protein|uniref:Uncharacterized protein n=1 Tax=Morganella morganii TaxID=582 RepID=A0AAN5MDH7_MORMO|nr:hypothetical protein [Morganella morganii]MCU6238634.1 hypothetical protein [Morganella morganii]HAT3808198.1 hypothetical protein [Morganella morganii]HED3888124.1 hypothetical protein [Morganella morganii]
MISSKNENEEKKSMMADIYGEAIFLAIPVVALIFITAVKNSFSFETIFSSLLLTSDWSIMSSVIFGQCAYKMARVVTILGSKTDGRRYAHYLARRIFLITLSLLIYAAIVFAPNLYLGAFQIILFFCSIFFFFRDSAGAYILLNRISIK